MSNNERVFQHATLWRWTHPFFVQTKTTTITQIVHQQLFTHEMPWRGQMIFQQNENRLSQNQEEKSHMNSEVGKKQYSGNTIPTWRKRNDQLKPYLNRKLKAKTSYARWLKSANLKFNNAFEKERIDLWDLNFNLSKNANLWIRDLK